MFCPNCGQKLIDGQPHDCPRAPKTIQVQPTQERYQAQSQPAFVVNTSPATLPVAALRKICSSTTALVLAIVLSVQLFANLVGSIISASDMAKTANTLNSLGYLLGGTTNNPFSGISSTFTTSIVASFISLIPITLAVVGVWLIHSSAKNPKNGFIATNGFSCLKVVAVLKIIGSVCSMILVLLCLTLGSVVVSMFKDSYDNTSVPVWICICIFLLVWTTIGLLGSIGLNKIVNAYKRTAADGSYTFISIGPLGTLYAVIKCIGCVAAVFQIILYFSMYYINQLIVSSLLSELGSMGGLYSLYGANANITLIPTNIISGLICPIAVFIGNVMIARVVFLLAKEMNNVLSAPVMGDVQYSTQPNVQYGTQYNTQYNTYSTQNNTQYTQANTAYVPQDSIENNSQENSQPGPIPDYTPINYDNDEIK